MAHEYLCQDFKYYLLLGTNKIKDQSIGIRKDFCFQVRKTQFKLKMLLWAGISEKYMNKFRCE